jgi:hypothetical protein
MPEVEVGPGDSVSVSPVITNTATEQKYKWVEMYKLCIELDRLMSD